MRKFTLIFTLLVAMVTTAMAQQSITVSTEADPVYYVIASYNRGGYLTNEGVGSGVTHVDLTDGSYWYFESAGEDGAVYFVNKLKDGENKIYLGSDRTASTTAAKWYILPNGVNKKGMSISSTNPISSKSCIDANNGDSGVGPWAPTSNDWNGTTWVFVDGFDAKYNPANLIFRSRTDRYVKTISLVSLGEESATIDRNYTGDNDRAYIDLTKSVTFEVYAEQEVTPAITRDGDWTNAYAYIDLTGDGFTASIADDGYTPAEDLVSYSFYSGDEANDATGTNSKGESTRNTIAMPSFTAPSEPGTYRMRFKHDWNSINPNGSNANFTSNGGSIIDVTLVVKEIVATATVNYSYKFNGVEKYTQTSTGYVDDEYPALTETTKFPFGITATKPAGTIKTEDIVDGVVNVDIPLEVNTPFACAESYENVKWQFLKFHASQGFYLNNNVTAEQNYIALNSKSFDVDNDNYYWGFIGNPFDGYKIVNKGAGEGYILSSATDFTDNGTTYPVMTETATLPEGNNELWVATASAQGTNGFYLAQKGFSSNAMNNYAGAGKLTYWKGGVGDGSTFMAEDSEVAIQVLIDEFKTDATKGLGCVGGYSADKAAAIAAIATYDDMVEFKNANSVIAFDVNKYYRIQNVFRTTFISVTSRERVLKPEDKADVNQLWQVENGSADGTYLIKSPNAGYMQVVGNNALAETGADFNINLLRDYTGQFELKTEGNNLAGINNSTLGTWWNAAVDGDMAYRFIEADEVEINLSDINGEGWATAYLPFDVTLPDGLTAYYVNEVNNGWVNLAEAADIPAKNGVVLYTKEPKVYTLTIADASAEITDNYLTGTTVATEIAKEDGYSYYILANGANGVGLYNPVLGDDATKFNNAANKAYLAVPAEQAQNAASFSFRFDGTTGVEKVEIRNEKEEIYDLTGRRVNSMNAAGIYIVNGRKVLVK